MAEVGGNRLCRGIYKDNYFRDGHQRWACWFDSCRVQADKRLERSGGTLATMQSSWSLCGRGQRCSTKDAPVLTHTATLPSDQIAWGSSCTIQDSSFQVCGRNSWTIVCPGQRPPYLKMSSPPTSPRVGNSNRPKGRDMAYAYLSKCLSIYLSSPLPTPPLLSPPHVPVLDWWMGCGAARQYLSIYLSIYLNVPVPPTPPTACVGYPITSVTIVLNASHFTRKRRVPPSRCRMQDLRYDAPTSGSIYPPVRVSICLSVLPTRRYRIWDTR